MQQKKELPHKLALRLATEKAIYVKENHAEEFARENCIILGADTVSACGRRVVDKTMDESEAVSAIKMLSGRRL